jgi:hypothetical protein
MGNRGLVAIVVLALGGCGDNIHLGGGTLIVSPQVDLRTSESGETTELTIALTKEPARDITVMLVSNDTSEGTVEPPVLVFTRDDFFDPQVVTLVGVDDETADGDMPYVINISGQSVGAIDLDVVNADDDSAGISVLPRMGLMTSEGGTQAQFDVRLLAEPSASVAIPLTSSDSTEGTPDKASLTFTPDNWMMAQKVTVTGQQDLVADGNIAYSIIVGAATSADAAYDGIDGDDVSLVNIDDDVHGIAVSAPSSLATSESGTQDTFTVVLQTQPSANVTIAVASSAVDEATVSASQLVFTPQNWNQAQTVTVTGVDDFIDDGNQPFTITLGAATSQDSMYAGIDPADPTGTNADNDTAGIVVSPTAGLTTSEAAGADTFTVVLTSEPTANVTIAVSSSDTTEGVVAPMSLVFTPQNWNQAQSVSVTGVDDPVSDGIQNYTVVLAMPTTQDTVYAAIDPADVLVENLDNDTTGITVDPVDSLFVSEFRDTDTFTIVLDTAPTANVTISLMSSNTFEGTVSPTSVTFTPQNWNVPQTITVEGVDDALLDGNVVFNIITSAAVSNDPLYNGLAVADVEVTNIDNDTAQVYVKARKRLLVSENGQSATFRVRLTVAPTATVTCPVMSSDTTEGLIAPQTLTFQPNQFGFQTVTVSGVDDPDNDGDIPFTIVLGQCTSADINYNNADPRDVVAINRDND